MQGFLHNSCISWIFIDGQTTPICAAVNINKALYCERCHYLLPGRIINMMQKNIHIQAIEHFMLSW